MGVPDPILNTKVSEAVKASWQLCCERKGIKPGVRLRQLIEREVLADRAEECLLSVGFAETIRRLGTPTYPSHAEGVSDGAERAQGKPCSTVPSL